MIKLDVARRSRADRGPSAPEAALFDDVKLEVEARFKLPTLAPGESAGKEVVVDAGKIGAVTWRPLLA